MTRLVRAAGCTAALMMFLTACGTTPAPDFRGRWREVNAIDAQPRPIPLRPQQRFLVLPSDRTLKDVVERWGRESRRGVAYRAPMNFSVHLAATKVTATDLDAALQQLASAYAAQAVELSLQGNTIVVTGGMGAAAPAGVDGNGAP